MSEYDEAIMFQALLQIFVWQQVFFEEPAARSQGVPSRYCYVAQPPLRHEPGTRVADPRSPDRRGKSLAK